MCWGFSLWIYQLLEFSGVYVCLFSYAKLIICNLCRCLPRLRLLPWRSVAAFIRRLCSIRQVWFVSLVWECEFSSLSVGPGSCLTVFFTGSDFVFFAVSVAAAVSSSPNTSFTSNFYHEARNVFSTTVNLNPHSADGQLILQLSFYFPVFFLHFCCIQRNCFFVW